MYQQEELWTHSRPQKWYDMTLVNPCSTRRESDGKAINSENNTANQMLREDASISPGGQNVRNLNSAWEHSSEILNIYCLWDRPLIHLLCWNSRSKRNPILVCYKIGQHLSQMPFEKHSQDCQVLVSTFSHLSHAHCNTKEFSCNSNLQFWPIYSHIFIAWHVSV